MADRHATRPRSRGPVDRVDRFAASSGDRINAVQDVRFEAGGFRHSGGLFRLIFTCESATLRGGSSERTSILGGRECANFPSIQLPLCPWQASEDRPIMATRCEQHKNMPDRVVKTQAPPDVEDCAKRVENAADREEPYARAW